MTADCVFCGIVAGEIPSVKGAETASTYAFMDINPANDGHLLVIPKQHSTDLLDIGADDLTATTLEAQRIARAMVDDADADGVNLLNCCKAPAWQTVFHFHLHVIPRYADRSVDRLSLSWQPGVAGDRTVMTEYAETLATALR